MPPYHAKVFLLFIATDTSWGCDNCTFRSVVCPSFRLLYIKKSQNRGHINDGYIFYLIRCTFYKNEFRFFITPSFYIFCQSLRVFPNAPFPFDWKFLKVGSVIVNSFVKNFRNLQGCRPCPCLSYNPDYQECLCSTLLIGEW